MLLPAKCPECGGLIEVNSEQKAANCKYCGSAFIVEEAVNNFNTYFNVTNIYNTSHNYGDGAVVNVYEDKNKDFVIEGGVLKKYQGASVDVVIPDGVVEIGENSFKDLKIKSVVIPDSVTRIGFSAFKGCSSLTSITIPDSVTSIGDDALIGTAFYNNPAFWENGVLYIGKTLIAAKETLNGSYTIKSGTKRVSAGAFRACRGLKKITIPDSVVDMGYDALGNSGYQFDVINVPIDMLPKIIASIDYDSPNEEAKIKSAVWKGNDLCAYCGGTFKEGLFSDKCTKCGRKRNY